jgi:4'-phosphopantetheinyl transferase
VWSVELERCRGATERLTAALAADELARVARFRFERDRRWFALRRGVLRTILGMYRDAAPEDLSFRQNEYGKPALCEVAELQYSLSHSCGRMLLAVTADGPVGVDIECVRAQFATETVPEQFFAADEVTELRALAPSEQVAGFFNAWTRKEAYIKARGLGLSLPLQSFSVTLAPGVPARLRRLAADDAQRWTLRALEPAPGYVGALVAAGNDVRVRCWSWWP